VDKELVQVLTMGRVGSLSVQRSIEKKIGRDVPHIHSVNPVILSRQVVKAGSVSNAARSVQEGLAAVAQLIRHQEAVKTVTLVRDAIARNLSAVFAELRKVCPDAEQMDEFLQEPDKVRKVWREFHDRRPYVWFDNELRDVLGIDVYLYPFPEEGIVTIKHGRYEVLIMRTELEDSLKSAALAKFLRVNELPLYSHNNEARTTTYSSRYEQFRRSIGLEEAYLRAAGQSRYMRHFYSELAIEDYIEHWMSETRPNANAKAGCSASAAS
jgi:hypothetical protein